MTNKTRHDFGSKPEKTEDAMTLIATLSLAEANMVLGWLSDRHLREVIEAVNGVRGHKAAPVAPDFDTAETFATGLNDRHGNDNRTFWVESGRRFDKIVCQSYGQTHVHAFVERSTGHVFKAAGWKAPAKGVRFTTVAAALEASDPFGTYLYQR